MISGKVICAFLAGAAVGAFAMYKYVMYQQTHGFEETVEYVDERENVYADIIETEGYDAESDEKEEATMENNPYVIPPDDFGECEDDGWETATVTLYSDGIVADIYGGKIDIDEVLGRDSLNHFGEYEDDAVFVRNERLKIDYEILRDKGTYLEEFGEVIDD